MRHQMLGWPTDNPPHIPALYQLKKTSEWRDWLINGDSVRAQFFQIFTKDQTSDCQSSHFHMPNQVEVWSKLLCATIRQSYILIYIAEFQVQASIIEIATIASSCTFSGLYCIAVHQKSNNQFGCIAGLVNVL